MAVAAKLLQQRLNVSKILIVDWVSFFLLAKPMLCDQLFVLLRRRLPAAVCLRSAFVQNQRRDGGNVPASEAGLSSFLFLWDRQ